MAEPTNLSQKDIAIVIRDFEQLSKRVNEIHFALMGSSLSKDGGMIQRLHDLENDTEEIKKIIEIITKRNVKNNFYIHVIFLVVGALLMSLWNQAVTHIFK